MGLRAMIIRTPADLGAAIRARRRILGLDQGALAARVGVQRQWVVKMEAGKATAEVGLVLRTLAALGLQLEIDGDRLSPLASVLKAPSGISYDIDSALERNRGGGALSSLLELGVESGKHGALEERSRPERRGGALSSGLESRPRNPRSRSTGHGSRKKSRR